MVKRGEIGPKIGGESGKFSPRGQKQQVTVMSFMEMLFILSFIADPRQWIHFYNI